MSPCANHNKLESRIVTNPLFFLPLKRMREVLFIFFMDFPPRASCNSQHSRVFQMLRMCEFTRCVSLWRQMARVIGCIFMIKHTMRWTNVSLKIYQISPGFHHGRARTRAKACKKVNYLEFILKRSYRISYINLHL